MATKKKAIVMTAGEIIKILKQVPASDIPIFTDGEGNYSCLKYMTVGNGNSWREEPNGDLRFYDSKGDYIFTVKAE